MLGETEFQKLSKTKEETEEGKLKNDSAKTSQTLIWDGPVEFFKVIFDSVTKLRDNQTARVLHLCEVEGPSPCFGRKVFARPVKAL